MDFGKTWLNKMLRDLQKYDLITTHAVSVCSTHVQVSICVGCSNIQVPPYIPEVIGIKVDFTLANKLKL